MFTSTWVTCLPAIADADADPRLASRNIVRPARSHATDCDAEGLEKVLAGRRIDASAFVEKVSGSRPGCP
jgi:hypothetical protein